MKKKTLFFINTIKHKIIMIKNKVTATHSQTQIGTGEIGNSSNKTIIGNSGNMLKPYRLFNYQSNRLLQIFGNTNHYGIPILSFVKTCHSHNYGGSIMWLSDNLSNSDKRFAQISGHIRNREGYITFNTRKESDSPGFFNSMIFNENGNLGIGTDNPNGWRLAVNGKIKAKEIKVETELRDVVFCNNYNLPTLKEVENHINEKGHLKDIPSAKEVEKNGISLGEMDSKLLQKIEELTLYTIQQQKEIEELKSLVKNLMKRKNQKTYSN